MTSSAIWRKLYSDIVHKVDKGLWAAVFICLSGAADASLQVKDVTAVPRWPWNGLVDISCEVVADDPNADIKLFVSSDLVVVKNVWLLSDSTHKMPIRVKPGRQRLVWDSEADLQGVSANLELKVSAMLDLGEQYLVVDLSGGPGATSYPVTYFTGRPSSWSEEYKTTKMVFRLLDPGVFSMGCDSSELGFNGDEAVPHDVALTKPFFMSVFETTQRQWELVMGNNPSSVKTDGSMRPVETVSYMDIRGSLYGITWPAYPYVDEESFLGKLQNRSGCAFDLPTEAQWEYACRAGTTTSLNNGRNLMSTEKDRGLDLVGRYKGNRGNEFTAVVGSYSPNAWGLYDMHGNAHEWCLDWASGRGGFTGSEIDPVGYLFEQVQTTARVLRGGSWYNNAASCRSAARSGGVINDGEADFGFRLTCAANLETASTTVRIRSTDTPLYVGGADVDIPFGSLWNGAQSVTVSVDETVITNVQGKVEGTVALKSGNIAPGHHELTHVAGDETLRAECLMLKGEVELHDVMWGNEVWSADSVHVVTWPIYIGAGESLTIEPGAVVKFCPETGIEVYEGGTLSAEGTTMHPIVFTSLADDEHGGDTNGDDLSFGEAGDWLSIIVEGSAAFNHCQFLYGSPSDQNEYGVLMTQGGSLTVRNSLVAHTGRDGIFNWGGSVRVEGTVFTDCGWATAPYRGENTFLNCVFEGVDYVLAYWAKSAMSTGWEGKPTFVNCIFSNLLTGWASVENGDYSALNADCTFGHCLFDGLDSATLPTAMAVGRNGNLWGDPQFIDREAGDYRIAIDSPCVDAGDGTRSSDLDAFGRPHMNVAKVQRKTGKTDAGGYYPDIGIYEVLGDGPMADLEVVDVKAPAAMTAGETVTVSWTVRNVGRTTATDGWRDVVEFVAVNGQVVKMGECDVVGVEIPAGASQTLTAKVNVPCAAEGEGHVRVTANRDGLLLESSIENNRFEATAPTAMSLSLLELPADGSDCRIDLAAGAQVGYRFPYESDEDAALIVRADGDLFAWASMGLMSTRDNASSLAVEVGPGVWLLRIPTDGTGRVVVANDGMEDMSVGVSLLAGDFLLFGSSLTATASVGASIRLMGNGFDEHMTCLVERGGSVVATATDLMVANALQATAAFDFSRLTPGAYVLRVTKGSDSVTLPLEIVAPSGKAKWTRSLEMASSVRQGRVYVGYFSYGNAGGVPMAAPYVVLKAEEGTEIRLDEADAWTGTVELMACSGTYPASVLKPGDSDKVKFFYRTKGQRARVKYSCTFDDSKPFTWEINGQYMRPAWASDEVWGLALATLKANVGLTWNAYLDRMRADCDHLMKIGQPTVRLDRIWQLEVNDALGVDHAASTLAGGTDLARSGRGLGLSLSRTYGAAMFKRFQKGVLGYGWSDNLSTYAERQDDTTLAFHLPSGATYQFTKLTGEWAPEDARDKTKLAETASAYVLTYSSGTVQTFAKSNMRTSSIVDNQGHALTFTYGAIGGRDGAPSPSAVTRVSHSDGQFLVFAYEGDKLASVADDRGRTVTYGYTGDLLTSVTAFNGLVTRYEYAPADNTPNSRVLTKIAYPDGTTKDFSFDDAGRVATASMNGNRFTTEIVRGPLGSYSVVAPNGGVTEVTVGASGETLKTVNALGQTVEQKYTADALLESVIAPSGKRNKISYNKDGRPVSSMSASGATTTFAYESAFDNLASVTDAKGHALGYGYDDKGRGETVDYVDGTSSRVVYDAKGDVVRSTNRRGESISYTYDAQGKLLTKTWPNGRTFTLTYDGKDNVVSAADSETGTVTMEYDDKERLTRIVHPKGRGFAYKYDAIGRTIERATLDVGRDGAPSGSGRDGAPSPSAKECYEYDSLGRLSRVTDGTSAYLTNAYDPTTGWLLTQTYGNGTVVSNAYDILGRTIGIYHLKDGNRLAFFEYAYDIEGKCISQTTAEGVERYTYDADGQLTSVAYPDGTSETFAYDAVGNRTVANGNTYEVNNMNQYTSVRSARGADPTPSAPVGLSPRDSRMEFTYDADGNLTSRTSAADGTTTYAYDVLNRLVAVTNETKNIRWSCQYDVFGNRTSVTDNGTTTEKLFVQGSLASVASEYVDDAQTVRHIMIGAVRLADINGEAASSPLDQKSTIRYYHADMLGSARLTTDATGAELARASYKAFGATRVATDGGTDGGRGATALPGWVGTLGVEKDSTGLVFMRNRYYDEDLGRFIQMDLIGHNAGDVNWYRYCGNDGVGLNDVSGLLGETVCYTFTAGAVLVGMAGVCYGMTENGDSILTVMVGGGFGGGVEGAVSAGGYSQSGGYVSRTLSAAAGVGGACTFSDAGTDCGPEGALGLSAAATVNLNYGIPLHKTQKTRQQEQMAAQQAIEQQILQAQVPSGGLQTMFGSW